MARSDWPRKIYIKQEGVGANHADVYDADTGKHMEDVVDVDIHLTHNDADITVTRPADSPHKSAIIHPPDEEAGESEYQGIVVEKRKYPIKKLDTEGGI